jgi:branched-chain amino acid transport system substrate-binding protein
VLTPTVKLNPDLLVLSGVAPGNAPLLIRSARELGYQGLISTETAQDAKVLEEGAGELANGFISVGGASTPEIRSKGMEEFIDRYTKKFGEYNDESNTKVYALNPAAGERPLFAHCGHASRAIECRGSTSSGMGAGLEVLEEKRS